METNKSDENQKEKYVDVTIKIPKSSYDFIMEFLGTPDCPWTDEAVFIGDCVDWYFLNIQRRANQIVARISQQCLLNDLVFKRGKSEEKESENKVLRKKKDGEKSCKDKDCYQKNAGRSGDAESNEEDAGGNGKKKETSQDSSK